MTVEVSTTIAGLDATWPLANDASHLVSEGDDHLRLLKSALKTQFPGVGGLGFAIPITAKETELNSLVGVTSLVQTQLNNKQPLFNTSGLLTQTAPDTFAGRAIVAGNTGISVANGDGVLGNPTLTIDPGLQALSLFNTNGILTQTANDTFVGRTIAAGNGISVTNGNGVAGNPTITLRDQLSVKDFGAVGDYNPATGTGTNDSAAFLAACVALGPKGGTVHYYDKHLIDTNLIIPANVTLKGPMSLVGSPGTNISAPYGNMACLAVNSLATITLSGGAGLDGCLVYRKGCQFPSADSTLFAGVAVTAGGDDAFLINSQVLGFDKAYYSNNFQRARINKVWFDCNNGIHILNCADVAYVDTCHGWPFVTIAAGGLPATLRRTGTAFKFETVGDWNKVSNCFAYAYFRGFWNSSCNSMTYHSCGADSTGGYAGQIGFNVDGTSEDTRFSLCQAAAQDFGYHISTSASIQTRLFGCDSWFCTNHGVLIDAGDVTIIGGVHRNVINGVTVNNAASRVFIDLVRFFANSLLSINVLFANADVHIGENNDYPTLAFGTAVTDNTNKLPKSIASADPLNLPQEVDFIQVTGIINFGSMNGGWAGRKVTLKFTGILTVNDGGASLKLAGNLVTAANTTLTLVFDGTTWCEVSRSVN